MTVGPQGRDALAQRKVLGRLFGAVALLVAAGVATAVLQQGGPADASEHRSREFPVAEPADRQTRTLDLSPA